MDISKENQLFNPGGGGDFLIWAVRVRVAGQGMVFSLCCPKQAVQFGLPLSLTGLKPVLNMVWY